MPGAAGAAGIDCCRLLSRSDLSCRVVATDRDLLAAGYAFSDLHVCAHLSEENVDDMLAFMQRSNVRVVLPTSGSDTPIYAKHSASLAKEGIHFAGSDYGTVELCDDKLRFYQWVERQFPTPAQIQIDQNGPTYYPCFVKPRFGKGSRDSGLCRSADDWRHFARLDTEMIAQEYLGGAEYSVDILSDQTGEPLIAIPRLRVAIQDGVSVKAKVLHDPEIEDLSLKLAKFLQLKGVSCIQLKRDGAGTVRIQEVNPRFGGSMITSFLAGVDLPTLAVSLSLGRQVEVPQFREVTVVRYFDQITF
ncbi:ATP-grasp domain-containing protein [Bradyrhizobium diazoefficiens]|uniref:ATP-grasp domain-containing protein n=1 Tax=Bradyrhizobium diazoefficiens TaxID=1355477 RepID=UPI00346B87EF